MSVHFIAGFSRITWRKQAAVQYLAVFPSARLNPEGAKGETFTNPRRVLVTLQPKLYRRAAANLLTVARVRATETLVGDLNNLPGRNAAFCKISFVVPFDVRIPVADCST